MYIGLMYLGYTRKKSSEDSGQEFPGVIDNFRVSNTIINEISVWVEDCKLDFGPT